MADASNPRRIGEGVEESKNAHSPRRRRLGIDGGRHAPDRRVGEPIVQGPRAADALVVVQGAKAMTASNPRRVERWGKNRDAVLVGEREFSPMVRNWLNASDVPPLGMERGRSAPSQDRRGTTTHILRSA